MADQLPAIVVLTPLFSALLITLLSQWRRDLAMPVTVVSCFFTLLVTILLTFMVKEQGKVVYLLGGWAGETPVGIHLSVDSMNVLVLVAVAFVASVSSLYSITAVPRENPGKESLFYSLYMLLFCGLLGITITGDAFNVFVLLEVSSLTSYALIAMGPRRRAAVASFNYVIIGTIGASFYLLGVGYLYAATGSLNMSHINELFQSVPELVISKTTMVAFILITVGFWIKMAFFPLYGWLPNAYTFAPSTSSCLLAPLMTKVTVYLMMRLSISVFGEEYVFSYLGWSHLIVGLAVIAILAGSIIALAQTDLKRMLCFLIVAEVGYMVGGFWLGNEWGMIGTSYHILSDALMTSCLFLAAGIFMAKAGDSKISSLDGIMKKMPVTTVGFLAGALAMIGIPPTCGFFSKWYLIRGGIQAEAWEYVAALLISSLVNAILFFRIIEVMYFGKKPAEGHGHHDDHAPTTGKRWDEAPLPSLIAISATGVAIILLGIFNVPIVELIRESLPFSSVAAAD